MTTNAQWGIVPDGIHLVAVEHCTNRCEYCSTCAPYAGRRSHLAPAFYSWLDRLFGEPNPFAEMDLAITGGEPFLHPDLFRFITEITGRYPSKKVGISTNFFWASERKIREVAPRLGSVWDMLITKYPETVARLGGEVRFDDLVSLLRELCPHLDIQVTPMVSEFIRWNFHEHEEEVSAACCTAFCYLLVADGRFFRCSLAYGIEHRPEYRAVKELTRERFFNLNQGLHGFREWSSKYPIDLCRHCTLWKGERSTWRNVPPE